MIADKLTGTTPTILRDNGIIPCPVNYKMSHPISERLLVSLLKDLDCTKSSGCLNISAKLYIDSFEVLIEQLLHLFNLSLKTQTFPEAWKRSTVIPLPKKGNRFIMENTGPISLIHICGKVMEKVVHSLIQTHINDNNIISQKQFGFIKNKSTVNCIAKLCKDLYQNMNINNLTCCVFLDFSKAFDSVSHPFLLNKLAKYGFNDIEWFRSYLCDRLQCVRMGNVVSSFRYITRGVPQGSVLGPTLFNLFLNDITCLSLNSKLLLYADDVVLYMTGVNLEEIKAAIQSDLNSINNWSSDNLLAINPSKTKALLVGRKAKINNTVKGKNLQIGKEPLQWVNSFSYLGLEIDENVEFNAAIKQMHRKAAFKLRSMYLLKDSLTDFGRLTMAKSMIIPYLDYGLLFMSSCHDSLLQRLQRLQNKVLKCALQLNRTAGTLQMHSTARVLLIKDRIRHNQLSLIHHGVLNGLDTFPMVNVLNTRTRSTDTPELKLIRPNTEHYRKSLFYSGLTEWNSLSSELKNCDTLSTFKHKLKSAILNSYVPP